MFRIGEKVEINPYWYTDNCKNNYGISLWRKYVGKVYTIKSIDAQSYRLKEDIYGYYWPAYMLRPIENSISNLLRNRKCSK